MAYESSKLTLEDELEEAATESEEILAEVLENEVEVSKEPIPLEKPGVRQVEVRRKIEEYLQRKRNKLFEDVFSLDDE
jgi:hypothetical protein